jgi:hypothetical protein
MKDISNLAFYRRVKNNHSAIQILQSIEPTKQLSLILRAILLRGSGSHVVKAGVRLDTTDFVEMHASTSFLNLLKPSGNFTYHQV